MIPSTAQAEARLEEILGRGSVNLGEGPDTERLMLMLTRSCELRCSYCFVQKSETRPVMPLSTALRAVDLLMTSQRSRLELQFFGGEPTREWPTLRATMDYAVAHPERGGRKLGIVLTTNGTGLTPGVLEVLRGLPVMLLFSLDGDERSHRRFRPAHLLEDRDAYAAIRQAMSSLEGINWFMNAVLPPAAAAEVEERYDWALQHKVPALQLNYAVGMLWSERQEQAYLSGLREVLLHHHDNPSAIRLFNWRSDCEPVMLSDDLIVDVDGAMMHDGAIFLERRFGALRQSYGRGHLDDLQSFDPLRWPLSRLNDTMLGSFDPQSTEYAICEQNIRMGAAVDLMIQTLSAELGR